MTDENSTTEHPTIETTDGIEGAPSSEALGEADARSAEEMLADNPELRGIVERWGDKRVLKTLQRAEQERTLKPFQAELIRMQNYLEQTKRRMIILFEGRDASGKGVRNGSSSATSSSFRGAARSSCSIAAGTTAPWSSRFSASAHPSNTRLS